MGKSADINQDDFFDETSMRITNPLRGAAMQSRNRRDTRLSKFVGITVDANGPSWKGPTAYPLEDPGNAGARDRRRVG